MQEKPDKILNVTFNFAVGSSINNIKFKYPTEPLYHGDSSFVPCPEHHSNVPEKGLWTRLLILSRFWIPIPISNYKLIFNIILNARQACTQILKVKLGDIVEIRFVGAENPRVHRRRLMWTYHTAHLHGHDMFLLDMGNWCSTKYTVLILYKKILAVESSFHSVIYSK